MPTTIYALCDPDLQVPVIRYIGKTGGPVKTRFKQHKTESSSKKKNHLGYWLRSLKNLGESPVLMVLTEVPDEIGSAAEILYIRLAREGGMDLVNATDGGDGGLGAIPSPETREKLSAASSGENNPMYGRRGINSPLFGRKHPLETIERMKEAAANRDCSHSEEARKKMSESAKASCARQARKVPTFVGRKHSEETKKKMSIAAALARAKRPKWRLN